MKKYGIILLLLIMIGSLGCGKKKEEGREPLTILTTGVDYEKFMEAFEEKYPDIKIEFISYKGYNQTGYIKECFESGELPDLVTTTFYLDEELQRNRLLDLSKYSFVNKYSDSWLNRCNVGGSIYLVPSNYSAIGIYYNKTLLNEHGWEVPQNFVEMKELAVKIREEGLTPCIANMELEGMIFSIFFGLGNTFYFNTAEGEAWKTDFLRGNSNAAHNVEPVLSYLREWVQEGFISPDDISVKGTAEEFYQGNAVFMLSSGIGMKEQEIPGKGKMEYGIMPWLQREGKSHMIINSVSRYYGLNKELEQEGNEQKLSDALCFMEFISSEEGMSLLETFSTTISPLNTLHIDEDDLYYEIKDSILAGNTIPHVYVGWDDIIIPMAEELYKLVRSEQTIEECAASFDAIRDEWLSEGPETFGMIEHEVSKEEAAKAVGEILLHYNEADAVLLSLGGYHGFGRENPHGIQCGIYPGEFTLDRMRTIVPAGNMCIVEMSGEELLQMKERGKFLSIESLREGEENLPFPYVLVTASKEKIEDEKIYSVIAAEKDLSEEYRGKSVNKWMPIDSQQMMRKYFVQYGTEIFSSIE